MSRTDNVRVRLHGRWAEDAHLRDIFASFGPDAAYRWREIELTLDDDHDVLVVFEHPRHENYDPARTVVFESEPAPSRAHCRAHFAHPRESFRSYYDVERHHSLNIWHVRRSDVEGQPEKTRELSAVVSTTRSLPRHDDRVSFVSRYLPRLPGFDHFGRGEFSSSAHRGEIGLKAEALLPYRYTFNAENWLEPNYFTEKILDAILCETLCFYDGCPNLELFLDPATFIRIELGKPEEALEIVEQSIEADEWSRRIERIRAQKRRLLDDLHPLALIRKVVVGEPVDWRPDRAPPELPDGVQAHDVDARAPELHRLALERIAYGADPVGVVADPRCRLADETGAVLDGMREAVRSGDLVVLGGTGLQTFRHIAPRRLPAGRELHCLAARGTEQVVAYAATRDAARALLRDDQPRLRGVPLRAVWPPVAYLPGPFMRADGDRDDVPLLAPSTPSVPVRVGGKLVSALPRGRRVTAAALEVASLAADAGRRVWLRGGRARRVLGRAGADRSSSYPPAS